MQNAAPQLGAALACEARAKPGGRPGISRATVSISHRNSKDKAATRRISAITIGVRHRRDLGDIEGLVASIVPGNVLIAGERRLAACAFVRWREVPVTVVDLDKVVKGEFTENSERKDLTLSEAVAIKRAIEPIERAEAALHESSCQRRLSELSVAQVGGIIERLDRLRPRFPAITHRLLLPLGEPLDEA